MPKGIASLNFELSTCTVFALCKNRASGYNINMARRRLEQRHIRKLLRSGGRRSITVTLPIEIIRKLKWRGGQKVVVEQKGKSIFIKDWEK